MARRGWSLLATAFAGCFSMMVHAEESITPEKRAAFGTFDVQSGLRGFYSTALGRRLPITRAWDISLGFGMDYSEARRDTNDTPGNAIAENEKYEFYQVLFGVRRNGGMSGNYRYFGEFLLSPGVGNSRYWSTGQYSETKSRALGASWYAGVEYFLHPRFSVEGKIGLFANYQIENYDSKNHREFFVGSGSRILVLNWYF